MGMTADEFWYDVPRLAEAYREAQNLRNEMVNQEAWLHGLYVMDAVAVAINNTLGGKGVKKEKYLERPIATEVKKQTPEEARQKVVEQLDAWKRAWEAKHENGER